MINLKSKYWILLAFFFLVMITTLWVNNIYLLVSFSLITYIVLPLNRWWDNTSLVLFSFSILYSLTVLITNQVQSYFILIAYAVSPLAFYRFGIWLMSVFKLTNERYKIMLCIVISYLLPLFILTLKDISLVGLVNIDRAMSGEINSDEALSATYYGLMASIGLGYSSIIFTHEHKLSIRIVSVTIALLSLLVVIHLVNRTGLVICVVCILLSLLLSSKFKLSKIAMPLLGLFVVCLLVSQFGLVGDDLITAYENRETNSSHSIQNAGGRLELWGDAIHSLFAHPLGWTRAGYAHNLWLDVARVGGVMPMLLLLLSTYLWLKSLVTLFKKSHNLFNTVLCSINIAMFLSVMVEPVLDCSILYFSMFVMIWGITKTVANEKILQ